MAFAAPAQLFPHRGHDTSAGVCNRALRPPRLRLHRHAPRASLDQQPGVVSLRQFQTHNAPMPGTVYLVGAGPGDPSLLTLQARDLLARADVILYDRLASEGALALANPDATTLYVGKTAGFHTRTQDEIHTLLAAFASAHQTVVRLKGGDPCVFGRGGEEAAYLRSLGVNVQIIPGVTAASGIAASLGFPLTHRGLSNCVKIATGHLQNGRNPDVGQVDDLTTLILYMGLAQLPLILDDLRQSGLDRHTPAVAVERGTTADQVVVWGTVKDLADKVTARGLSSPTLVVVGRVVSLAHGWAEEMLEERPGSRDRCSVDFIGALRPEDRTLLVQSIEKRM